MMEKLGLKGAAEDAPAVILTKTEHAIISQKLAKARNSLQSTLKPNEAPSKAQVWAMYQDVYKDRPNWLKAIARYFQS